MAQNKKVQRARNKLDPIQNNTITSPEGLHASLCGVEFTFVSTDEYLANITRIAADEAFHREFDQEIFRLSLKACQLSLPDKPGFLNHMKQSLFFRGLNPDEEANPND